MLAYTESHRPSLIVYENVDAIDDKGNSGESNLNILMESMKALNYAGQRVMTDAQQFGLPCRRRRLYVLFVDTESSLIDLQGQAIGQVFATFRTLVASCVRSHPCVTSCLLQEGGRHNFVIDNALSEHRQNAEKQAQKKNQPQNTWIDKHIAYAESLGVRWSGHVDVDLQTNEWYCALTTREQDALVLSQKADPASLFRNLSQSVGRINSKACSDEGAKQSAPTVLPGQLLWVEPQQRLLTGEEALMLQGFPILQFLAETFSPSGCSQWPQQFLHDLAGNAMALPVALAIFQSGLASVPLARLREESHESDQSSSESGGQPDDLDPDVVAALAAFDSMQGSTDQS
eukprot:Skav225672  [mRNA]  locus=scaffold1924:346082:347116:- [translate_table: standard]